jgi:RimJ/RimL family protein N-acetyltransferase
MIEKTLTTPHGPVFIRPGQGADAPAYRELRLEALRLHPEAFGADYDHSARQPMTFWTDRLRSTGQGSAIYFAGHEDKLIGMCGIYRGSSAKTRHTAVIWGVYVQAAWRGLKLADELIASCLDWGQEQGVSVVKLAAVTTNVAAIRCYTRCGFTVYGVEPQALRHDGVMYDELLLARQAARTAARGYKD